MVNPFQTLSLATSISSSYAGPSVGALAVLVSQRGEQGCGKSMQEPLFGGAYGFQLMILLPLLGALVRSFVKISISHCSNAGMCLVEENKPVLV